MIIKLSERVEATLLGVLEDRSSLEDNVEYDITVFVGNDENGEAETMISIYLGLLIPRTSDFERYLYSMAHMTIPFNRTSPQEIEQFVNAMWDHVSLNRISYKEGMPIMNSMLYVCSHCGQIH